MSQGSPARTVGARLREAREKRGVSLRQIANTTRISVMSLEALERSDLSRLPGGIFTRAFIRTYAQEVGLDPDRIIEDFIAELPPESAAAAARPVAMEDGDALESDRKAVTTAVKLVLVSLPIAAFLIYYGMQRGRRPAAAPAPAATATGESAAPAPATSSAIAPPVADATVIIPAPAAAAPAPTPAPAAGAPVALPAAAPRPTGLTMDIAPKADCFVSVTVDGEQVFSGLMRGGEKRQVSARDEISLNVGDAGAFAYTLNGKQGRPLGAPGEVVSKRITLAEAKDYVTP
jgi:cytoskeletal protein RodZ